MIDWTRVKFSKKNVANLNLGLGWVFHCGAFATAAARAFASQRPNPEQFQCKTASGRVVMVGIALPFANFSIGPVEQRAVSILN